MGILEVVILGIVEGISEFLPISSTSHLIIVQKLLGLDKVNQFFTVVIQFGAILAAMFFFRDRIKRVFIDTKKVIVEKRFNISKVSNNELLGLWIILGTIPALVIGFILKKKLEDFQNSLPLIIFTTIFFGIAFYLIEKYAYKMRSNHRVMMNVNLKDTLFMGFCQALAIIPGVSRSGAAIAGGMARKINIKDAIEVSFLMGIPIILAATVYEVISAFSSVSFTVLLQTALGTVVAFITGLYSIKLTLGILSKRGFAPFMFYRIGLGLLMILLVFMGVLK